jgi:hypothetical protein
MHVLMSTILAVPLLPGSRGTSVQCYLSHASGAGFHLFINRRIEYWWSIDNLRGLLCYLTFFFFFLSPPGVARLSTTYRGRRRPISRQNIESLGVDAQKHLVPLLDSAVHTLGSFKVYTSKSCRLRTPLRLDPCPTAVCSSSLVIYIYLSRYSICQNLSGMVLDFSHN